jgi:hypothetical protein
MTPKLDRAARRLIGEYRTALTKAGIPLDAVVAGYRSVARAIEIHVVTVIDAPDGDTGTGLEVRAFELEADYSRRARDAGLPISFLTYVRDSGQELEEGGGTVPACRRILDP